ncbi:MAG: EF-hand domain-containing protein [Burkholderiaceae bacterium]
MASAISSADEGSCAMQRLGTSRIVNNLFSKIDTKNQGYIDKEELQTAIDKISILGESSSSTNSATVDEIFKTFDSNGDGMLSKQDVINGVKKLADWLDMSTNKTYVEADTDKEGKRNFQEFASNARKSSTDTSSKSRNDGKSNSVMTMMIQLLRAYGGAEQNSENDISVTA